MVDLSQRLPILALSLSALAVVACGGGDAQPEPPTIPGAAVDGAPPAVGGVTPKGPGASSQVPRPTPEASDPKPTVVAVDSLVHGLERFFTAWQVEEEGVISDFKATLKAAVAAESPFASLVVARYASRDGGLLFARDGALTPAGDRLIEALLDAHTHGLPADRFLLDGPDGLKARLDALRQARQAAERARAFDDPQREALWAFALARRGQAGPALKREALEAGLSDADLPRVDALRPHLEAIISTQKALNAALIAADRALAEGLHRYVFEMRFALRAHPFRADRNEAAGIKRVREALVSFLDPFFSGENGEIDVAGALAAVTPAHPDYARLREAYGRYRELAAAHPEHLELGTDVERLRRGRSGKAVEQLARRLAQEGYYTGEIDDKFGPGLEAAVIAYQQTHQLRDGGALDRIMRLSLNRTFAERAEQLALGLQRMRESELHQGEWPFGAQRVRGRVNIPAFEATFFVDGVEARRHRVVVGNNQTETHARTGKKGKLNQTRMFSAEMATVVLNPTWNVPRRIKEQELDLMLMDEPDYYAKNNFEVKVLADGTEQVVQQPGAGNALGLVKFLFPNEYAIYMHDTPSKRLFSRPVRAFSHGCMRTENPLDLARWILVEVTERMDDETFDSVLASRKESAFALRPRIPMTTDYSTVGFDGEGRLVFYADIYGFDRDYLDGKTPYRADRDHPNTQIF